MATFDELGDLLFDLLNRYQLLEGYTSDAAGYIANDVTAKAEKPSDLEFADALVARVIDSDRANLARVLGEDAASAALAVFLVEVAFLAGAPNPLAAQLSDLRVVAYDYMRTNSKSVKSRQPSFGTPTADGGNAGDTMAYRNTKDQNDLFLAGWMPDTYRLECIEDSLTGGVAQGNERWRLKSGSSSKRDNLDPGGAGIDEPLQGRTSDESLLKNASFDSFTPGATAPSVGSPQIPSAVGSWTPGSGDWNNFLINLDETYRPAPGAATSAGLECTASDTFAQSLTEVAKVKLLDLSHFVALKVKRKATATGSIKAALVSVDVDGAETEVIERTVDIATLTDTEWNVVKMLGTEGQGNWPSLWLGPRLTYKITITLTAGTVVIDDQDFFEQDRIGARGDGLAGRSGSGHYLSIVGGREPAQKGDFFAWTDSMAASGVIEKRLAMNGLGYLPSATPTGSISEA